VHKGFILVLDEYLNMKITKTYSYRISSKNKQASAVAAIYNDKILILKRSEECEWSPNKWNIPGGGVKDGESTKAAAAREFKEESGIDVKNLIFLKKYNTDNGFELSVFVGDVKTDNVKINFESSDYAWIDKETVKKYDCVENTPDSIFRALD